MSAIKTNNQLINVAKLGYSKIKETSKAVLFQNKNPFKIGNMELASLDDERGNSITYFEQFWCAKSLIKNTKTTIQVPVWAFATNYSITRERV